ncbi:hypothetical protein BV898_06311 [Hypsibius exemplaris]|uniref:Uncharacterized protein n=1 Tax=Hypsibius exemplaris TaxID=2072580 RepID=A0A1W0WX96_HYPEX|nr:hypothetical protein BV898_06311 [Hypsibius exemplaris]
MNPPQKLLFDLLLPTASPQQRSIVLPLKVSSPLKRCCCTALTWGLAVILVTCTVLDVGDIVIGGYLGKYSGRINPLISLASYCATQIQFASACPAIFFLILGKRQIERTAASLEALARSSDILRNPKEILSSLRRLNFLSYFITLLGLINILSPLADIEVVIDDSVSQSYFTFQLPLWVYLIQVRATYIPVFVVNYLAKILFAYFTCFLYGSAEEFHRKMSTSVLALRKQKTPLQDGSYVELLRGIRVQNQKIIDAFEQLQKTFSLKLLLDMIGIVAGLCNAIAWFVVWFFSVENAMSSGGFSVSGVFRHLGLAFIDVSYLWLVLRKPILLHSLVMRNGILW